jgi:hypothetical protein
LHAIGIAFVIIGQSGSILAYWQAIDKLLNRDLMIVTPPVGARPTSPTQAASYRNVAIDPYRAVLAIQDRARFSAGESINEWIYPLHCGEAFCNLGSCCWARCRCSSTPPVWRAASRAAAPDGGDKRSIGISARSPAPS